MKRFDAAAAELAVAETLDPGGRFAGFVRGLHAAAKGDRKAALGVLASEPSGTSMTRNTYFRSRIYAAFGMKDEAIGAIRLGIDRGFSDSYDYCYFFPFINNTRDYFYEKLRGDPRFDEILRSEERKYADMLEKYTGL